VTTTPVGKTNYAAVFLLVIFSGVIVATMLGLTWLNASPYETLSPGNYPAVPGDHPAVAGKARTGDIQPEAGPLPEGASDKALLITVAMKGGVPTASYRLPASGTWGLPRFFFEQDQEKGIWSLVFVPPAGKGKYEEQLRTHAPIWRQVSSGAVQPQPHEEGGETGRDGLHRVTIPSRTVRVRTGVVLKDHDYELQKTGELPSSAVALSELARDEAVKQDLLASLEQVIPGASPAFANVSDSTETNQELLEKLADAGYLYLCRKVVADGAANTLLDSFYFDAYYLRWVGPLPFRRAGRRSPRVEVRLGNDIAKFEFESAYLDSADNPVRESRLVSRFQAETAARFARTPQAGTWPADQWLLADDPGSLNPMSFVGVLQSLRAVYARGSRNEPPRALEDLVQGVNESNVAKMRVTLNKIANTSDFHYHSTYLFCEYIVALVNLRALADDLPSSRRGDYRRAALTDLILEGAKRIANNVTDEGHFKAYLFGPTVEWSRSVAQAALYTLQHVELHSGGDPQGAKMTTVRGALRRLAGALGKYGDGVASAGGEDASPSALDLVSFQASLAKLQLGSSGGRANIAVDDFQKDLAQLDSLFTSSLGSDKDSLFSSYKLMCWARVYELLELIRLGGGDRVRPYFTNDHPAIGKLRGALATRLAVLRLQQILPDGTCWAPDPKLSLRPVDPPAESRDIMLVIALQSLHTADAMSSRGVEASAAER
jgi:hypothetical protein